MSDTVDRRIVEMRFDNEQFEKNVGQTLITLETLKKALELSDAGKGLEEINKSASQVDLSGVQNGVEQTTRQFSALEVMAVTALANITNSAVNAGKRLVSSFVSPLIQGGKQRAQNMAQAKFMFEGFQYSAEQIGSADKPGTILGEVYKSVEGTFYSLDKAALVASQFLATGMGIDELQKNLKGVAGVASVFGADYQRVGEIFGKVRTQGKLMGQDLMSLNVMGVPTIAKITEYLNKDLPEGAKKSQEEVSAMVSKGKIDFDTFAGAMEWAFGEQASKSKKLFSGAVEDMRAAMARIGEKFWGPMLEVARDFFNASVPLIDNFSAALSNAGVYEGFANAMQKIGEKLTFVMDILAALFDYQGTLDNLKSLVASEVVDESRVKRLEKYKGKIEELRETIVKILNPIGKLIGAFRKLLSATGGGLVSILKAVASGLGYFLNVVADGADHIANSGDKIVDFFTRLKDALTPLASGIFRTVQLGLEGIKKTLGGLNFGQLIVDSGFAAIGVAIWNVMKTIASFAKAIKESGLVGNLGLGTMFNEFRLSLIGLQTTLKVYQNGLKANVLLKIAGAILALAVAVKIMSDIPAAKLATAVLAVKSLFTSLIVASTAIKPTQTRGLITMAAAIRILAGAVKKLSDIPNLGQGLLGVGALLSEITAFCLIFSKLKVKPRGLIKTALGLVLIATAIRMLVKPVNELGQIDSDVLKQGLLALGGILIGFVGFAEAIKLVKPKALIKSGLSLVLMASAIRLLVKPIKELGALNPKQMARGLKAIGLALLELVGYATVMGKIASSGGAIIKAGLALVLMATGVRIMSGALDTMSGISNAGQGLGVLFASLGILAGAMLVMQKAIPGAAAMIIVAAALTVMAPAIMMLSSLDLSGVGAGLLALAGTLGIFAGASLLLGPAIPLMIGLGAALALLGVGVLGLGSGMTLLAAAFVTGLQPIMAGIEQLSTLIPIVATNLAKGLAAFLDAIVENSESIINFFDMLFDALITTITEKAPALAEAGFTLLTALLTIVRDNEFQLTVLGAEIVIEFLNGLSSKIDEISDAGFNFVVKLVEGVSNAIETRGHELVVAIQGLFLSVLEIVAETIPVFGKYAADAIKKYKDGLSDGKGKKDVETSAKTLKDTVEKGSKLESKTFSGYGKNVTKGLTSGMDALLPDLRRKAREIADIVDKTVRKRNEIKSPSRRLMRTGEYMMMGLIAGVDSLTSDYQNRADSISTMLIDSMESANSFNSLTPVINPVFGTADLSQLSASVNLGLDTKAREEKALADNINSLAKSLNSMTDTMNSRALNNYITIDGSSDPEAFADDLIRSFRLNARTV